MIERWGFCDSECEGNRKSFMFANLNILNNDECETLLRSQDASEDSNIQPWNKEHEICVGKKHPFPKPVLRFSRIVKRRTERLKEMQRAEERMCHKLKYLNILFSSCLN